MRKLSQHSSSHQKVSAVVCVFPSSHQVLVIICREEKIKIKPRSLKGSIWMVLRMGDGSRTRACLASAVPIAARDRQTEYFCI